MAVLRRMDGWFFFFFFSPSFFVCVCGRVMLLESIVLCVCVERCELFGAIVDAGEVT